MIADIGTRRNSSLDIINPNSPWFRGYEWMTKPASEFPVLSAKDISLNQTEHQEAKKICIFIIHHRPTQASIQRCGSYCCDRDQVCEEFAVLLIQEKIN